MRERRAAKHAARLRRAHALARVCVLGLGVTLAACQGEPETSDAESSEGEDEGESETGELPVPGNECQDTPLLLSAPATVEASLRGATGSAIPANCGITGPVVFYRVRTPARVDLSASVQGREAKPKLALMRPGCVPGEFDPSRILACVDALPLTLFDLEAGQELIVAVGLEHDDPALELTPELEAGELDPLAFLLELDTRVVLEEGERCEGLKTRCEAGTVCLPSDDLGQVLRCQRTPADSCADPGVQSLELAVPTSIEIPLDEAHSDAHEHTCTGWRRPERVDHLELPASLPPNTQLRIRANDGRVGLALRGPGCTPAEALACAPATGGEETVLQWGGEALIALAAAGEAPLLFVELPRPDTAAEPVGPVSVSLELLSN